VRAARLVLYEERAAIQTPALPTREAYANAAVVYAFDILAVSDIFAPACGAMADLYFPNGIFD
jgi:hypothetical protein